MKKKQSVLTIIGADGKFIAPNRATHRMFKAKVVEHIRLNQVPNSNVTKSDFAEFRKELALKHGSKTGKLKKKHINRERKNNETNV
jgi:hypothetical protein